MRRKLFIGIPAFHHMNAETQHTLENLLYASRRFEIKPPFILYNQSCIPFARNTIHDQFLASEADFCFQMDADISIRNPKLYDSLDRLLDTFEEVEAGIVGAIYPVKNPPFHAAPLTFDRQKKPCIYEDFFNKPKNLHIKYCATGFMMYSRAVADAVGRYPYNLMDYPDKPGEQMPEDYSFCERALQKGFTCAVNTEIELYHTGVYYYSMRDHASFAKNFKIKPGQELPPIEVGR